jgi:hypothetical protein
MVSLSLQKVRGQMKKKITAETCKRLCETYEKRNTIKTIDAIKRYFAELEKEIENIASLGGTLVYFPFTHTFTISLNNEVHNYIEKYKKDLETRGFILRNRDNLYNFTITW